MAGARRCRCVAGIALAGLTPRDCGVSCAHHKGNKTMPAH